MFEPLRQAFAFEQVHHEKRDAAFVTVKVSDRQDMRMAQRRNQAGFILEALIDLCAGSQSTVETISGVSFTQTGTYFLRFG